MTLAASEAAIPASTPVLAEVRRGNRMFAPLVTLAFWLVCMPLALNHAIWLDEAQAYLLARDSRSLPDLLHNMRYEGHPPLWHFLIFILTRFTVHVEAMQVLHVLLAATTVYVVARFSPFPLAAKILFPFGYFPLFEYGIISRNYQIVMLLAFATCALWQRRPRAYLRLALLLVLLCLSHVMGVILAAGLGVMILVDAVATPAGRSGVAKHPVRVILAIVLAHVGAAAAVYTLIPPADSGFAVGWHFDGETPHVLRTLYTLPSALLPIPGWDAPHAHMKWLMPVGIIAASASALGFLAMLLLFIRSWRAALLFGVVFVGQLTFLHVKYVGSVRHHGCFFIGLLCAAWVAWAIPRPAAFTKWRRTIRFLPRGGFVALLAAHVFAAAIMIFGSRGIQFAAAREAAAALAPVSAPDEVIVPEMGFLVPGLAAYLPGRTFHSPITDSFITFLLWRRNEGWDRAPIDAAQRYANATHKSVIYVCSSPLKQLPANCTKLTSYYSTRVITFERYIFYRVQPE